jgi:acyl transferase domain-containing protein
MLDILKTDIAIIGMAGQFPGADNIEQLWNNILNKVESISLLPDNELIRSSVSESSLSASNYVKSKGCLNNAFYLMRNFLTLQTKFYLKPHT